MNGFRKICPTFLSHYAMFFAKMAERKVIPFDEFYYQLKLMHLFQKHPVYSCHTTRESDLEWAFVSDKLINESNSVKKMVRV
jgi:hypothetical protein